MEASGFCVFKKEIDGRLDFGIRGKTISKTPAATNAPRIEKAIFARTVFCWRMM